MVPNGTLGGWVELEVPGGTADTWPTLTITGAHCVFPPGGKIERAGTGC
jgi:hypothetical protein